MTADYLSIFINSVYAKGGQLAFLSLFFLFMARLLPIIALSPFFGSRVLPNPTKVFFAITLFIIFLPQLLLVSTKPIDFNELLVLYLFKEFFVGIIIGTFVSIPYIVVQCAGVLTDHQRGGASLMVNDPTIMNQSSPLGTLYNMVLIVIFYSIDGPFLFLNSLLQSYELVPPDQFLNPVLFTHNAPFWTTMIKLLNDVMVLAIQIAAPALLAILMTDVFLGIANRLAPQVQITFLGMPIKSLLALMVICIGWIAMTDEFAKQSRIWLNYIQEVIKQLKV